MRFNLKILFASALLLLSLFVSAQNIPSRPNPPRLVNDFAGVLSAGEVQQLEQQLDTGQLAHGERHDRGARPLSGAITYTEQS
jgi:uncharacterized membrane protein YgcG